MEALGINPMLLVAQTVSFLVLFWVFNKFLFGKIEEALRQRRESVAKIFRGREEIESRLAGVEKELEDRRREMHRTEEQMEEEAKKAAAEIKKQILAKAEVESEREIRKAQERIRREAESARIRLKQEVTGLAAVMAEKIIREKAGDAGWQQQRLRRSREQLKAALKQP